MVVAVAVLLLLSFVEPSANANLEPETAIVAESIDNEGSTEPNQIEKTQASEPVKEENDKPIDFPDSFDEDSLNEEYGDVQEGIDLLNSPLQ